MIERVTYTTQPSAQSMGRYITVYAPDGSYVSRHINMEECTESALAHAQANEISGTYRFVPPEKHMSVQIVRTVPGVYTGSFIASPLAGRINARGFAGSILNAPYDLGILPSNNVQNIQFAAEPTTTSTATVTNVSDLLSSVSVSGRRTIVSAGTYNLSGAIVFTASNSNHWLDVQPGVTINSQNDSFWGLQMIGANHIKITGSERQSTFNSAIEIGGNCSDLYLDGVRLVAQSNEGQNGFTDVTRLTILNSYISGNLFSFYSYSPNNMIVANTQIVAGPEAGKRAAIRMGYANTVAFVDCNIVTQHATDHMVRVEADANDVWFARNQGECTSGGQGVEQSTVIPGPTIADNFSVYWEDNSWYDPSGTHFQYLQEGGAVTQHHDMRMTGERFYSNAQSPGTGIYPNILDWSISDSVYAAYTAPPAWNYK